MSERTCWWATCGKCEANVAVAPHFEKPGDVPHYSDWEVSCCPVCGEYLDWNSDNAGTVTL